MEKNKEITNLLNEIKICNLKMPESFKDFNIEAKLIEKGLKILQVCLNNPHKKAILTNRIPKGADYDFTEIIWGYKIADIYNEYDKAKIKIQELEDEIKKFKQDKNTNEKNLE